ncbi:hypothetical protein MPSI1_001003 [Malassezia psittaci]|uniref:AB hydrolase-1 domain-containing protein n=1 Tax=Malassezia psittaci TaxID=1821823 RepID=A0AAF0JJ93_9BASI|nr:hypothetical protein MPSI1_001003 [Malassezia psittaci]
MTEKPKFQSGIDEAAATAADVAATVSPESQLPASILPMPSSMMTSVSSWWSLSSEQTAEAELYLLRKSGYFEGATLGNAGACQSDGPNALSDAFQVVRRSAPAMSQVSKVTKFSTMGTKLAQNGKVGMVRLVDIGDPPAGTHRASLLSRLQLKHTPRLINTLEIGTPVPRSEQDPNEQKIVLVHGYAAGLAFFYKNFGMFGAVPNSRFFALDWLGMGRSSRPPYTLPHSKARSAERVEAAESYFLTSLEQWREKMQIDKMVLVGHSLGGYLSIAYALKYPERVERLVLVSPVGIPEGSWDLQMQKRLESQQEQMKSNQRRGSDASEASAASVDSNRDGPPGPPRRFGDRTLGVLGWLWDRNGDSDWMDVNGGINSKRLLKQAGNNDSRVLVVPNAGHHVYLDNAPEFNKLMSSFLQP